jgi:hypothetical protein
VNIAFKEWAAVDRALGAGEQSILLRKGGIHERHDRFEVEHREFLLYPTYVHQQPEAIKPAYRSWCVDDRMDRAGVTIRHLIRVEAVLTAPVDPSGVPSWSRFHIYSDELVRQRLAYKPERPLFVLLVRVYRLAEPATIEETPAYAGCRSWVALREDVSVDGAAPVMADDQFDALAAGIREAVGRAR